MSVIDILSVGWILFAGVGGWLLRNLWGAVEHLREDLHQLEKDLPERYVSKIDLQPMLIDIKTSLARIESRLESKADKP